MDMRIDCPGNAIGFEQITVAATAIGFTAAEYKNLTTTRRARAAFLTLEGTAATNDIRFTLDGTTPTTTIGHLFPAGVNSLWIFGKGNIENFRAIRVGGTSGTLTVTFFD